MTTEKNTRQTPKDNPLPRFLFALAFAPAAPGVLLGLFYANCEHLLTVACRAGSGFAISLARIELSSVLVGGSFLYLALLPAMLFRHHLLGVSECVKALLALCLFVIGTALNRAFEPVVPESLYLLGAIGGGLVFGFFISDQLKTDPQAPSAQLEAGGEGSLKTADRSSSSSL